MLTVDLLGRMAEQPSLKNAKEIEYFKMKFKGLHELNTAATLQVLRTGGYAAYVIFNWDNLIMYGIVNKNSTGQFITGITLDCQRSTKPPGPSCLFTGRREILSQLSEYFGDATASIPLATQRIFVLFGMGGAGKTQIALKFVNEYRSRCVYI